MIVFRQATPEDVPFVRDSFWRGAISADSSGGATIPFLCRRFSELIDAGWAITVACDDATPQEIIGWILARDRSRIAWVHVKGSAGYRRARIATRLVMSLPVSADTVGYIYAPFMSDDGHRLAKSLSLRVMFRPFIDAA